MHQVVLQPDGLAKLSLEEPPAMHVPEMPRALLAYVWQDHNMAEDDAISALRLEYGEKQWWGSTIQSYARMKLLLRGQGLEQNHLVHAAFFRKGPHRFWKLVDYVPCLTLSMEEHRGKTYSYHKMKDGQKVGSGKTAFEGCGMDAFLRSRRLDVNAKAFSTSDISKAIDVSAEYWEMIGINHAAAALREFKTRVFQPLLKA